MKNTLLLILIMILYKSVNAQLHYSQSEWLAPQEFSNLHVQRLNDDSLSSTFAIWVKQHVKEHYHEHHTEVVYVLEGAGEMTLNDERFPIKKGDYVFIPLGTKHSVVVKSEEPMKVISIQSPYFDGSDRVFTSHE